MIENLAYYKLVCKIQKEIIELQDSHRYTLETIYKSGQEISQGQQHMLDEVNRKITLLKRMLSEEKSEKK